MSRVFLGSANSPDETYLNSPASAVYDNLTAITLSAWVYVPEYSDFGGPVFVKDPQNTYAYSLFVNSDGRVSANAGGGTPNLFGHVQQVEIINAGSGYAFADDVEMNGSGDAFKQVCRIFGTGGGGAATDVGVEGTFQGTYTKDNTYTTNTLTGGGSGLTLKAIKMTPETFFTASVSNETVPLNTWTHIAMTIDELGDNTIRLYINGVECTYDTQTTGGSPVDDSADGWYIGNDTFDDSLNATIAEPAIYASVLSGAEIAALAASTDGATGDPVGYWHLCGTEYPEPDASGNGNDMSPSSNPPAAGPVSPGFSCVFVGPTTSNTVGVGAYGGNSLAEAFFNPHQMDILQVVNEGGDVVWSLAANGTASENPTNPTPKALLGRFEGQTFALAFYNPYSLNILQIVGHGDNIVFWIDSTGAAGTA